MDTPTVDEVGDAGFRRRFIRAYRGAHQAEDALLWALHPDQPGLDGQRSPASTFQQRAASAYRQDVTAEVLHDLSQARDALRADADAIAEATLTARTQPPEPPAAKPPSAGSLKPRPTPVPATGTVARVAIVIAAAAGTGLVGYAIGLDAQPAAAPLATAAVRPSAQQQVKARVATSAGEFIAEDYYRLYPDDLPLDWGGAATGSGYRTLRGAEDLPLHISSLSRTLLIVVTCPAAAGQFRWSLSGARAAERSSHSGACGDFLPQQARLAPNASFGSLRLALQVTGPSRYGVTVFER